MSRLLNRHFPLLSKVDGATWMVLPVFLFVTMGVMMGGVEMIFGVEKTGCNPCHDIMSKRYDEWRCTGRIGEDGSFDNQLEACRKRLGDED